MQIYTPHVLKPTEVAVAQDESADVRLAAVNSWGDLDLDEVIEFSLKTNRHDLNRY